MIPAPRTTTRILRRSSERVPPIHFRRGIPGAPGRRPERALVKLGPGSNRARINPIGSADCNPPRSGGTGAHRNSRYLAQPTRCLHRLRRRLFENSSKASPLGVRPHPVDATQALKLSAGKECNVTWQGAGRTRNRFAFESQNCYSYGRLEVLLGKKLTRLLRGSLIMALHRRASHY